MQQITIRAPADLILRVKRRAADGAVSMNEFVVHLLDVATDPARATSADGRLLERLRAAGLLEEPGPGDDEIEEPDAAELADAMRAAGRGTPGHVLIDENRDA